MPLTDADRKAIQACQPKPSAGKREVKGTSAYRNGLLSVSMGVHASQVDEFNGFLEKHGITESRYLKPGQVVSGKKARHGGELFIASQADRNKIMKLTRRFDRDAGFGDYAGR